MQNDQVMAKRNDAPLSMGNYLGSMFILLIPIVGIIMLFIWSFSSSENINKKNWARAMLVYNLIFIVISILILVVFGAAMFAVISEMGGLYY